MSLDDLLRQAEDRSSPARLARLRVIKVHADRLRATIKAVREEASRADASWRADRATIQTAAMLAELEESARALARLDGVDTDSAARNPYWLAKLCKGLCAALDAAYVEPAPNVFWASWCAIDAARVVRWSPKVEAELDAAYAEWRKTATGRATKRLRIIPPPTRPIRHGSGYSTRSFSRKPDLRSTSARASAARPRPAAQVTVWAVTASGTDSTDKRERRSITTRKYSNARRCVCYHWRRHGGIGVPGTQTTCFGRFPCCVRVCLCSGWCPH